MNTTGFFLRRIAILIFTFITWFILSGVLAASDARSALARRHGIYMMHPLPESDAATAQFEQALTANPHLSGVLLHTGWSRLETTEGKYDFSRLDATVEAMRRTGKDYGLQCDGAHPPDYVYAAGAKGFTYLDDNPHHGARYLSELKMPLPWDPIWQQHYERMLRTLGTRYGADPRCRSIVLTVSRTAEMHFPRRPEDIAHWQQYGDFRGKTVAAYKKFMDILAGAFPRQQLVLMVSQTFGEDDSSANPDRAMIEKVIDYGLVKYPDHLTLQTNQLDGRRDQRGKLSYDILQHYQGRLPIGFQSLASFKNTAERQGSMELAALNYVRAGAEYWELWRGDGLDPDISRRVSEVVRDAQSTSPDAYQTKLVERGLYRTAEQDTYPQKVQEMRRQAIEQLERERQKATGSPK